MLRWRLGGNTVCSITEASQRYRRIYTRVYLLLARSLPAINDASAIAKRRRHSEIIYQRFGMAEGGEVNSI